MRVGDLVLYRYKEGPYILGYIDRIRNFRGADLTANVSWLWHSGNRPVQGHRSTSVSASYLSVVGNLKDHELSVEQLDHLFPREAF